MRRTSRVKQKEDEKQNWVQQRKLHKHSMVITSRFHSQYHGKTFDALQGTSSILKLRISFLVSTVSHPKTQPSCFQVHTQAQEVFVDWHQRFWFIRTLYYNNWEELLSTDNGITIVRGGLRASAILILFFCQWTWCCHTNHHWVGNWCHPQFLWHIQMDS